MVKKLLKLIKIVVINNLLQTISTNSPLNRLGESYKRKLSNLNIKLVLDLLIVNYPKLNSKLQLNPELEFIHIYNKKLLKN